MAISKNIAELTLRLKDELSGNSENARKRIVSLEKTIQTAARAATAFGLAAGAIGTALFAVAKSAANYGDEIAKASDRTGASTEFLSGMRHAAELADVSFEELQGGVFRLSRVLLDAEQGLAEAQRTLDALGISARDHNGHLRTTEEIFFDAADALAKLGPGLRQTALAQELFGRSGARMLPLLKDGAQGLRAAWEEARRLGIVIDEKTAKASEEFNDNLTRLTSTLNGLKLALGAPLIALFDALAKKLLEISQTPGFKAFLNFINVLSGDLQAAVKARIGQIQAEIGVISNVIKQTPLMTEEQAAKAIESNPRVRALRAELALLKAGIATGGSPPPRPRPGPGINLAAAATDSDKAARELAERTKKAVGDTRDILGEAADFFGSDAFREEIAKVEAESIAAGTRINEIFSRISREGMGETEQKLFDIRERFAALSAEVESAGENMGLTAQGVQHLVGQLRQLESTQVGQVLADETQKAAQAATEAWQQAGNSITNIIETFSRAGKVNVGTIITEVLKLISLLQKVPGGASAGGSNFSFLGAIGSLAGAVGKLFSFQLGGTVPGPIGKPQLAMVHGGEEVLPHGRNMGGNIYNIDARGAQRGVSTEVMRAIRLSEDRAVIRSVNGVRDSRLRGGSFSRAFD